MSLDVGLLDQLDRDLELDFNAEGFDFLIDGTYEQQHDDQTDSNTATAEDSTNKPEDDEIGYDDDDVDVGIEIHPLEHSSPDEAGNGIAGDEAREETADDDVGKDVAGDDTGEIDFTFQDEIGYEDEEGAAAGPAHAADSGDAAQPVTEATPGATEGHLESEHGAQSSHGDEPEDAEDMDTNQDFDFGGYGEHGPPHDRSGDEEEDGGLGVDNRSNLEGDEFAHGNDHEQSALDHDEDPSLGPSELDKAIQDLANSLPGIPEIEVVYNDTTYLLFGSSDDDPESYFLSDTGGLDRPLSQFLSAIRQVISNEVLPSDRLLISVESLDLEFGERSNEKFLNRTLRELLDCYAAMAARNDDIPATPLLQLIIQHDCEERFLQLLHDAGRDHKESPHSEHVGEIEDQDPWPENDGQSDEQDEAGGTETPIEALGVSEDIIDDSPVNAVTIPTTQAGGDSNVSTAGKQDSVLEIQLTNSEHAAAAPSPPRSAPATYFDDENKVDQEEAAQYQEASESVAFNVDSSANVAQVLDAGTPKLSTKQPDTDIIDSEFIEAAGLDTLDEIVVANGDGLEQATDPNGHDVLLAYDDDAELSMILEQEDHAEEEIIVAMGADANTLNDSDENDDEHGEEGWPREASGVSGSATPAASNYSHNDAHVTVATAADPGSVHTSTTMNGDEIDYEEYGPVEGSFNSGEDRQTSAAADGGENDEIDWENDGDEDDIEQLVTDERSTPQKQQEISPTPSSLAAKRSRTDETESPAEGSDHKRRRT